MRTLPSPWNEAREATILIAWIYDHLLPHAAASEGGISADAASHYRS